MNTQFFLEGAWAFAFFLNTFLIAIAQRLPLLTPSGWVHAGALGTILWGCLGFQGWLVVVIYLLLGSLVTRLGITYKKHAGLAEGRGGRRGPENLWGSAATGTFLAIFMQIGYGSRELLLVGFAASFASKLADTFGSEIGKRWGRKTFLITTLRSVEKGTDGAISLEGTLASALGSLLMTIIMLFTSIISEATQFWVVFLVGFLATLLESLIGAIVQNKYHWLTNEVVNFLQTTIAACLSIFLISYLN